MSELTKMSEKSEVLLKEGCKLTKEMKSKKIKDMKTIDEVFEKIAKKVQMKKA